ncbi:MAG TPA: efflux RND transporter permease subunit [Vicinamibacterales bacterium]|jgi:HAE1 family hydrophobic/amphiphilic exporter-1|nr:efflux RND transporter permease subunit [Vicinamibacterales bacterium]
MNFAEPFIKRPVATTLLVLTILIFGIMGYRLLPVSDLPTVDYPTITVNANLPGANPDTMANSVATPLEKQFSTISGVTSISSRNSQGSTSITLQFDLSRNIDAAAQDVQSMIARTSRSLPPGMPSPPSYNKSDPSATPVLFLTLNSKTLPLIQVTQYAEDVLVQRLSMVSGVAQVNVYGEKRFAVRVDLDPVQLAARQIGVDQVATAINAANSNRPTGTLYGPERNFVVMARGQLMDAEAYRPIIIAYRNGNPVRLEDIAHVYDGVENPRNLSWFNGVPTVYLAIQRQPGTNTVEVVDAIKDTLPQLQAQLPASLQLQIRSDRSIPIRDSVQDVKFTLLLTVFLVILVIFLFLRNVSATIIPSLALPFSIVGTFAVMWSLDYSLDNLSLMALTLSVGFVVDDAIVMLENIVRHLDMGKTRMQAALDGSKEISFTILSMTISLAAVFIPILFMGGIVGRLMHEFAVTIAAAILVSGLVSLTLTPMLCSRFLKPQHAEQHGVFYNAVERMFDSWLRFYSFTLRGTLRFRGTTMLVSALMLAGTVYLFEVVPKGFIPSVDTGQISGNIEAIQGIGFESMASHMREIMGILEKDPNVAAFTADAGGGRLNIDLKPREERSLSADQIIDELRPKLSRVPGVRVFLSNPPAIRIGGIRSNSAYQYTLQDPDTDELYRVAPLFEQALHKVDGLEDISSDLQIKTPQLDVLLDREQIAALGLTVDQVQNALNSAYGQRQVSQIFAPNDEYQVIMQVEDKYQRDPAALSMLSVTTPDGKLVPLSAVVTTRQTVGPQSINHAGQLPAVTLSFNLRQGVSLGDAVERVNQVARETLPDTVAGSFQGTAQAFQDSMQGLGWILGLAIFVIYVVLGILYESFIHPLTILSGLPSAGFGALLTLLLFRQELDLYAFVGIIMLVGIVKKNGIIMIDFAIERRREGVGATDAIYEACLVRFRPIMMTTMAALMGTLPIAFGWGAGGEARRPLGLAVVGGLMVSQTLTLYVTPVFYVYMEKIQEWLTHRRAAKRPTLAGVGAEATGK